MKLRVGLACVWDEDREATWSHIPSNLRAALAPLCDLVDLELQDGPILTRLRVRQNSLASQPTWVPRPWNNFLRRLRLEFLVRRHRVDVVLQVNDLAPLWRPYWLYRDMTWQQVADYGGDTATGLIDSRIVERQAQRERHMLKRSAGIFVFSQWAARSAREQGASRVVVTPPGINVPMAGPRVGRPKSQRVHLLFIGRAFERKGGHDVLHAFALLRQQLPSATLTVVGPGQWPGSEAAGPGVSFKGPVAPMDLPALLRAADVFVLPSRFEAYGIAFAEALAHGLPCVAREVCAMPEILDGGLYGKLVGAQASVLELANAMFDALQDDDLHKRTAIHAANLAHQQTWAHAAIQMIQAMESQLQEIP